MKPTITLLTKVITLQFYKRNAGLFLLLFVVLFGVAQDPPMYHYRLMQSMVQSPATLCVACALWLLYGGKCASFVVKTFAAGDHVFLKNLQALPKPTLYFLLLNVQVVLMLPVTIYAVITAVVGVYLQHYAAAASIVVFIVFLHVASCVLYYKSLLSTGALVKFNTSFIRLPQLPKPFYSLLLWNTFFTGKLKTIAVKFCSFVLLFMPLVWNGDHFDFSDFVIFFQIAIAAHAVVCFDQVQFLEKQYSGLRNMPVPLYKFFLLFLVTNFVLLLPEALILVHYSKMVTLTVPALSLVVYFVAQLLFFTSLAYEKQMNVERYLMYVGLITVLSLLITPLRMFWQAGCVLVVISFVTFYSLYYGYEQAFGEDVS